MNVCKALGEAITLHYMPTNKFTTDYFSIHFSLPLREETVTGYSLLTKLFKKGCRAYPTQASLAKALEELYSATINISVSKQGEQQVVSLGTETLSSRFVFDDTPVADKANQLLCDVLTDPYLEDGVFSSAYVAREKVALKNQIRAAINNKNTYALKRCREIMCEGEAYSLALDGTEEAVELLTPASLYSLYLDMLRTASIEFFYIGSDPVTVVEERIAALLARFPARAPVKAETVIMPEAKRVKRVTESVSAVQGKLAIGFRTGLTPESTRRDKDAVLLFNLLYGASPVSKLFMNVREKLSLCYYCASRNDTAKGVLFVYSGIENANAQKAEEEILFQLQQIQNGAVTEEELLCAKRTLRDLTRSVSDSPSAIEQWYLTRLASRDNRSPEQVYEDFEMLTVEDAQRAAKRVTLDTVFFLFGEGEGDDSDEL